MMRSPHHPLLYAGLTARAILAGGIFIWRRLIFAAAIRALACGQRSAALLSPSSRLRYLRIM